MDWLTPATAQIERIFLAARQVARDDEAAWDCVQEAFATALEREPEPADAVAWLCGVARNHARHHVRARSRWLGALRRLTERPQRGPVEHPHDLNDALSGLPLRQRDAVTLRYLAGMTFAEVARAQGISETAAKARVRRGLAGLRRMLGGAALVTLLAREALAARGSAAALKQAALVAPVGGLVMKKWVAALVVLVCALTTALVWRAGRPATGLRAREEREAHSGDALAASDAKRDAGPDAARDGSSGPIRYPADRPKLVLRGLVADHLRRPVAGAVVRVFADRGGMLPDLAFDDGRPAESPRLSTDAHGRFAAELPSGPYRVVALHNGLRAQRRLALASSRPSAWLELPEPGQSHVVLVVDRSGSPVPGARVEILAGIPGEGVRSFEHTTDDAGLCALRGLDFERALLHARTDDGRAGWGSASTVSGDDRGVPIVVTVDAMGSLEGRLSGVDEERIESARLSASALATRSYYSNTVVSSHSASISGGRYRFESLTPGSYVLTLDAPRGARLATRPRMRGSTPMRNTVAPVVVEVRPGQSVAHDLDLEPGAILEGVVMRENGSAAEGALVRVTLVTRDTVSSDGMLPYGVPYWRFDSDLDAGVDHPTTHWRARADANGSYRFASLPNGTVRVEVFADGLTYDRREEVPVSGKRTTRLEHRLVPDGVLQLALPTHLIGNLGLLPEGSERPVLLANTAGCESVSLPGLPPGRYRVVTFSLDEAKGLRCELGEADVVAGRTTWLDLRDSGPYVIVGHVRDSTGPVAGLRVRSYGAADTETDPTGAFELRSHCKPDSALAVEVNEGAIRHRFLFSARAEGPTPCEITLPGNSLVVRVQDSQGEPARAEVAVRAEAAGRRFPPAHFAVDGECELSHLPATGYAVTARFAGGGWTTVHASVPEVHSITVREPPTGRIEVEVEGAAAPDVVVAAHAHRPADASGRPAKELGWLEAPIGAGRAVILPSIPAGRIQISLQPRERREENPIRTRLNDGPPRVYHRFDLEAGETVRLTLAIDS